MDVLTLILVRVPSRKLMQFKCVSKSWHSLIATAHFWFLRSLLPLPPPSGLFVQRPFNHNSSSYDLVRYIPLRDEYNDTGEVRDLPTFCNYLFGGCEGFVGCRCRNSPYIRILDSSNGLLLCSSWFFEDEPEREHYIYNPTTNQLATLPRPTDQSFVCSQSMTLAFSPSSSPHYKVIALARVPDSKSKQLEIYSSETKSWRVSGQPFPQPGGIRFTKGVYCNGSVYWISDRLKYEDDSADCLFFNLNEERLGKFPKPPIRLTSSSRRSSYFGNSEDHLHFIEIGLHVTPLYVYELKCDHSGWFAKYQVDLTQLSEAYPQNINHLHYKNYYRVAVLSVVRRDRFVDDDSFLVLDIPGKVIRYNLVNRSFEEIFDHKVLVQNSRNTLQLGGLNVWQYVECHSSV